MALYLLKRVLSSLLLIWALLTVVFFLIRAAPGDPLNRITDHELDTEGRELIRQRLGLDQPLPSQYLGWLEGVILRADFGLSLRQHRPVSAIISQAIPNTLLLTGTAFLVHLLTAITTGVLMARYRGRPWERVATVGGLTIYSLPSFWLGLMLILLFGRFLGWFPAGGMMSPDAAFLPWHLRLVDRLHHLVLPVVVLGLGSAMGTARYLRNSLAEVLGQDYILAARAKGLPERTVLLKHALRNGLLPVITLVGLSFPFLLGGAVVAEVIFAWPGMGRVTIDAIWARDYPVIMGTTTLAAVMVVLGNLLADLLYGLVDPRVRLTGRYRA
jgi:peptide/nickel transport system permease protein